MSSHDSGATIGLKSTTYGYDNASRLLTVNDGNNNTARYNYLANSPLVGQIAFQQNGKALMTTTKSYDSLNRLTAIESKTGVAPVSISSYQYNSANQRTKNVLADGSYWIYQYDNLGQVTNSVKYFADGTLVPAQQFGYGFDDIGNRQQTTAGGDANGAGLRPANYTVNNLNQITARDYPGTNDVLGAALATNAVTVNGQSAWRKGEYFQATVKSNNTASAQWEGIMVVSGGNTNNGNLYVPQTPEQFSYDADGNLTNDGRWAYSWDAENRLIQMTNNTGVGPKYGLTFAYDAKGRRIRKNVATNGVAVSTTKFLYDGWNLIAETRPNNTLIRSYVWGTDLSGTSQGAGGVGGLLEINYYGSSTTNCFPAYDGNGNIMALVNVADGTVAANYDYAAFGEPIRITGVMARNNPFRFSTKYADDESDLLYYGYRYYKPSTGTWLSRDPFQEKGGKNVYSFVSNRPISIWDLLGLTTPVDVLDAFFGDSSESLWIMDQNNDYTKRMQQWGAVQQALNKVKADLSANCSTWESNHKTSPNWKPTLTSSFSPDTASYRVPVSSPAGTGPGDAIEDYLIYKTTRHMDDNLWYSTVGSFTLCVTVDKIDCCAKKVKLKIWIYNPMTKQSFGVGNYLYPFGDKENQYMWWDWTEDYSFGSTGVGPTKGGSGGWW